MVMMIRVMMMRVMMIVRLMIKMKVVMVILTIIMTTENYEKQIQTMLIDSVFCKTHI